MTLPIDERVAKHLTMDDMGDVLAPARIAHELGFDYLCWLYLMEAEVFGRLPQPVRLLTPDGVSVPRTDQQERSKSHSWHDYGRLQDGLNRSWCSQCKLVVRTGEEPNTPCIPRTT